MEKQLIFIETSKICTYICTKKTFKINNRRFRIRRTTNASITKIQIENNSELGAVVSSRVVAEEVGRQHKHVLEGIDEMIKRVEPTFRPY